MNDKQMMAKWLKTHRVTNCPTRGTATASRRVCVAVATSGSLTVPPVDTTDFKIEPLQCKPLVGIEAYRASLY